MEEYKFPVVRKNKYKELPTMPKDLEEIKQEPMTLSEKVDKLTELIETGEIRKDRKVKKFRLPFKAKVNKNKLSRGYITVLEIFENGAIDFKREQIIDGTIKLKDTYHSVDDKDCLTYKGKPFVIIPKKSTEPYNPNYVKNTTFSQKHIMSRMMNETIGTAKKIGIAGMSIGVLILVGVIAYAFIAG